MFSRIKRREIPDQAVEDRTVGFGRVLEEVANEYDGGWVTFESAGSDHVVEVAFDAPHFILNIPHAEPHGLLSKLQQSGFAMPTSWIVRKDKKKGFLSRGFLEVEVERQAKEELAAFVHRFVRDFLRWPESQSIAACLQK
jgi:hypothetical protein